jgi:predicted proteasome-type protease
MEACASIFDLTKLQFVMQMALPCLQKPVSKRFCNFELPNSQVIKPALYSLDLGLKPNYHSASYGSFAVEICPVNTSLFW